MVNDIFIPQNERRVKCLPTTLKFMSPLHIEIVIYRILICGAVKRFIQIIVKQNFGHGIFWWNVMDAKWLFETLIS